MFSRSIVPSLNCLLILFLLPFASCRVSLVPAYDSGIEDQVIKVAKQNDRLYLEMKEEILSERKFAKYTGKYIDIEVEINSLLLKNQARRQAQDLSAITRNLKMLFTQFKEKHRQENIITDAEILLNQSEIAAAWKALLVAEKGLKPAAE